MLTIIHLVQKKGTHGVEPEFGEGCIVKLKESFANRDFADVGGTLLFISFSGSCITVGVLQRNRKYSAYHLDKNGLLTLCVKTN